MPTSIKSIAIALIFCASATTAETVQQPEVLTSVPQNSKSRTFGAWGVDLSSQDGGVRPGDDFYKYQNGKWLTRIQFGPNEKAQAFWRYVRVLANLRLGEILQSLAADKSLSPQSGEGKVAAFYRSFMDQEGREARGVSPLKPRLDVIRAVKTKSQLAQLMGQISGPGFIRAPSVYLPQAPGWSFFRLDDINQDPGRPDRFAIFVGAGGLVLRGPEYYLDPQFSDLRKAYAVYIAKMLTAVGWPDPESSARQILDLETEIAKVSWSHEKMLDSAATYNPISVSALAKLAPGFDWRAFLKGGQLAEAKDVVIDAKGAFPRIAAIYAKAPLELLKARQAFGIADQSSDLLDSRMLRAGIEFRGDALGDGVYTGGAPLPLRAELASDAALGEILSTLYIAKYSSPQVKAIAEEMASNMRAALDARLQTISWMSPAGRAKAREKLANMTILIGYPDKFEDYGGLDIHGDDFYGDFMRSAAYQWKLRRDRLGMRYDRSLWSVRPEYPNFNYNPSTNTVEIPAALLEPPFFNIDADAAVNYGSVGSTIGAMIAAPFFARQYLSYDADGRLNAWLSPEEMAKFNTMWTRISDQYSAVESLPGLHLKGALLADEALGDLAGLEIALDGYHRSLKGQSAPVLDGFTGDQRFFLGRAQMWQAKFVDSFIRSQTATGSNEPPFMRVNGLLPNMDAWYAAFDVKPSEKLYVAPGQRVEIW